MNQAVNIEQILNQQLTQLQQLESLLHSEKETLQQSNPDLLISLSEQKNELLVAIQELDNQIAQSVAFREEKKQGLHTDILQKIADKLAECKRLNTVNGEIIAHSQLAVERMKTSLLQNHNKSSMTYDNKGKTSGGLSSLGIKA